jgi:threonine/homoserine/homoserine lactone efflux protein
MRVALLAVVAFAGVGLLMGMSALAILGAATELVSSFAWPLGALAGLWLVWRGWQWWRAREKDKQRQAQQTPSAITFYAPINVSSTNTNSSNSSSGR